MIMDKYVITISRQFGALGRTIAQHMAMELGIDYFDRDIVEETALRMGLPVSEISKEEERAGGFFAEKRYPLGMGPVSMQEELFLIQSNIIKDFAAMQSCIIVGRCGDYCLRNADRALHVYVYSPYEKRLENCTSILGMDEKTARDMIKDVDKARDNYRKKYCKDMAGVFDNRDICIDSSKFGAEATAKILCGIARSVFK
ncbi:cytidylate kinase-like family protein [Butyrivibrio sp. LB2008]|jgi:cytidylate kinase|uniref:cytidylate kinase-like family protein n=2 Tax=unclassified Butyrivibrio TaxID=2639466 RepID=UPI00047D15E7|nr:cytidylate kinase-like family protein [Butyrivibrio sp. LB2008]